MAASCSNPDGSFTYTPNPGYVGSDSFTYTADDGLNPPVPATVDITVDSGTVATGLVPGGLRILARAPIDFVGIPPPLGQSRPGR